MTTHTVTEEVSEQPSYDPLAALTIDELNSGSRQLKASLVGSITGRTEHYEAALAVLLWLHRRRADPGASLAAVRQLSFTDVTDELAALTGPDPTDPGRSPS